MDCDGDCYGDYYGDADHDLMEKVIMDRRVLHFSDEFTFDIHGRKRMCFGLNTLIHLHTWLVL